MLARTAATSAAWTTLVTLAAAAAVSPEPVAPAAPAPPKLVSAWTAQATLDASRGELIGAALGDDVLVTLTSAGVAQAFEAETGVLRWTHRVGDSTLLVQGPTVAGTKAAIVVGSHLYVLDAVTGRRLLERRLPGAVGGPPAMGADRVFTAMVSGLVVGLPNDESSSHSALRFYSGSEVYDAPIVVGDRVYWTTDSGELFGASASSGGELFRFRGAGRLVGPTAALDLTPAPTPGAPKGGSGAASAKAQPIRRLFVASQSGYVYSLEQRNGVKVWREAVGGRVTRPAVAVGRTVYVGTDDPRLVALDASTGAEQWAVDGVERFLAVSGERVYAASDRGELVAIDPANKSVVLAWPSLGELEPISNQGTDRLYFASASGRIECLREEGSSAPLRHMADSAAKPGTNSEGAAKQPADTTPADEPGDEVAAPGASPFDAAPDAAAPGSGAADSPGVDEGIDPFDALGPPEAPAADDGDTAPADGGDDNPFDF